MKSHCNSLYIILSVCMVITTFALSDANAVHELFKSIDKDADGKINREEFSEDMEKQAFERLDLNKDRNISMNEWESHDTLPDKKKHMELFERMDTDRDRRISFLEFSDYAERYSNVEEAFMGLDKDGSNNLSPDELTVRPLFKWITIRF